RTSSPADWCFNGAPASPPEIAGSPAAKAYAEYSFNGAPASPPEIGGGTVSPSGAQAASTELRRRRRRSPVARGSSSFSVTPLQRSSGVAAGDRASASSRSAVVVGFNGAPASPPEIGTW